MSYSPLIEAEEPLQPQGRLDALRSASERAFLTLDVAEVKIVRRTVRFAQRFRLMGIASVATRCGNGWLYPFLSLLLVLTGAIANPPRFVICAALSVLPAFIIYPALKRFLSRRRPCDYDALLVNEIVPLDRFSCPSGHAMTAVAFAVALIFACPAAAFPAAILCALIGWSRVALGHHYVSDVLIGAALGAGVATPIALFMF